MGHCQKVSNVHYADQDAYNREIPQNILQNNINIEHALSIIHTRKVSPAYENPTFFDQNKSPMIDAVLSPMELLKKYSRCEISQTFTCFGDNCSKTFLYEGDWRKHMNHCKASTSWYCGFCNNGYEYGTYSKVLEHFTRYCKMKPNNLQKKFVVMKPDFKCECGNDFCSEKGLLRHKRENCHLILGNRKKQKLD